jgi:uncharacterized protein (TIGR03067 family)
MRMSTLRTMAVLLVLLAAGGMLRFCAYAAPDQKAPAAPMTDKERLQGTWTEVEVERDGKREKKENRRAKQLVFRGDKLLIKEKGKEFECSFKLDPKQNPKTIDITVKDLHMVQQGIYRLEEDTLTMSFGKKERPSEFNSASNALTILKREPPKK